AEEQDTETENALKVFADALGLLFQIRDDILDIEGTTEQIGKPRGSDIANSKATYPALFGIETARSRTEELLETALAAIATFDKRADRLRELASFIALRDT
ncbi:MAG: polyprenyl synthetase family protein, partial [Gammaproteobacteria bacterium]